MKISKDFDPVSKEAPSFSKGATINDYSGIQPHESAIKETPGEREMNETAAHSSSKKQPFGKGGSGYCD